MAHIFKHPTVKAKGIIVFTHKEMNWFFPKQGKIKLLKSLAKKPSLKKGIQIIKSTKEILKDFEKIRKHYFIGVHIGGDPSKISHFENCDFYLATDEFDNVEKNDIMRIPLLSRNFTPIFFNNRNYKKYWDILCISRNPKLKNLEHFLSGRELEPLGSAARAVGMGFRRIERRCGEGRWIGNACWPISPAQ